MNAKMSFEKLWQNIDSLTETILKENINSTNQTWIDIESIVNSYNIKLEYKEDLPQNLDGQFNISKKDGACLIMVNKNKHVNRQRFTLAHEFGHFISYKFTNKFGGRVDYDDGGGKDIIESRNRDEESSLGTDLEEMFANQFAASILMPKTWLEENFDKSNNLNNELKRIANLLQVSTDALEYRLLNLKMIGI
jgi:Zn-dependent peptidase ImmA (M78 family)